MNYLQGAKNITNTCSCSFRKLWNVGSVSRLIIVGVWTSTPLAPSPALLKTIIKFHVFAHNDHNAAFNMGDDSFIKMID